MSRTLQGKVALVTGASRGIGTAIARALSNAGADLALLSTSIDGTRTLAEELRSNGQRVMSVAADVGEALEVDQALGRIEGALGIPDILVNNAGIVRRIPLEDMEDEDFDDVLRVNLSGPFYFLRRLVPKMATRGRGRVINVSSISGTLGTPKMSGYCASKWGLDGLTKALAEEYRGRGVMIAAVLPSGVDTDMLKGSDFPATVSAEDVARTVLYLASDAPLSTSGALVEVYG